MSKKFFRLDFLNKHNHIGFQCTVFRIFKNFVSKNNFLMSFIFFVLKMCQHSASEVPRQGFGTFWCTYKLPLYAKHEKQYILRGENKKSLKLYIGNLLEYIYWKNQVKIISLACRTTVHKSWTQFFLFLLWSNSFWTPYIPLHLNRVGNLGKSWEISEISVLLVTLTSSIFFSEKIFWIGKKFWKA